jgi:hypothetical protein
MIVVLPPESAIGAGMHPMVVFLIVCVVAYGLGYGVSRLCHLQKLRLLERYSAPGLAAALPALFTPLVLNWYHAKIQRTVDSPLLALDGWLYWAVAAPAAVLAFLVAFVGCRGWMQREDYRNARYYWYFFLALAFMIGGCLYAKAMGAAVARQLREDPFGNYARVSFKDGLQNECGGGRFKAILISSDDYVLLAAPDADAKSSGICADVSATRVIVAKKEVVQAFSITNVPRPPGHTTGQP